MPALALGCALVLMPTRRDVIVLDNGGSTIKVGFAGDAEPMFVVPNCIAKPKGEKRSYICDEIAGIKDVSCLTLRRPVDRGYVVNWDLQTEIWAHVFGTLMKIDPTKCHLLVTEPHFNLPSCAAAQDEVVFKHFGFKSALTSVPASLVMAERLGRLTDDDDAEKKNLADDASGKNKNSAATSSEQFELNKVVAAARCGVVVDVGFSFAHCTPVFDGRVVRGAVRRVNLGGKALTNYLKELVSYRQWNMMDEYFLVDDVKEKLCYVAVDSDDFEVNLARARGKKNAPNEISKEYVLPDGVHVIRGYVKAGVAKNPGDGDDDDDEDSDDDPDEGETGGKRRKKTSSKTSKKKPGNSETPQKGNHQTLQMGNERFSVPEALFHPNDLGLKQGGIAEATKEAVESVKRDAKLGGLFYANVVLCGGCCLFPGFAERFVNELRPMVNGEDVLHVTGGDDSIGSDDPVSFAWRGGSRVGAGDEFARLALTRDEYLEDPGAILAKLEMHAPMVKGRM